MIVTPTPVCWWMPFEPKPRPNCSISSTRKVQADGNGAETPLPLADYIEIGVFSGKKDEEKPLYLEKEKLTEERKTFEIIVDQAPTLAGIDPYNKLIDRNADDNMIDITRR
jgi:ABC-2 type transport system permease protein